MTDQPEPLPTVPESAPRCKCGKAQDDAAHQFDGGCPSYGQSCGVHHPYEPPAPPAEPVEEAQRVVRSGKPATRITNPPRDHTLHPSVGGSSVVTHGVEAEDEGARPLDELWQDYHAAYNHFQDAPLGSIDARAEALDSIRDRIEAVIRKEATAALAKERDLWKQGYDDMSAAASSHAQDSVRERTRAEAAEGSLQEVTLRSQQKNLYLDRIRREVSLCWGQSAVSERVLLHLDDLTRALTAESVTPDE